MTDQSGVPSPGVPPTRFPGVTASQRRWFLPVPVTVAGGDRCAGRPGPTCDPSGLEDPAADDHGHAVDVWRCCLASDVQGGPTIKLFGEVFAVDLEDDLGVVISHSRWSLMGYGKSIVEAGEMLLGYAQDLAEAMVAEKVTSYTPEGILLRDFVLQFLRFSPRQSGEPS